MASKRPKDALHIKHCVSSCRTRSHVLSCHKLSATDRFMGARQSLTCHSPFSQQSGPFKYDLLLTLPAQLHCHPHPAAGNLPPPPQPPPFSTESKHDRGKWYSSWTNVSCLLHSRDFAHVPNFPDNFWSSKNGWDTHLRAKWPCHHCHPNTLFSSGSKWMLHKVPLQLYSVGLCLHPCLRFRMCVCVFCKWYITDMIIK